MDGKASHALLDNVIGGWENEVIEFKGAGNDYSTSNIDNCFGSASRQDIDRLLLNKLSDALDEQQRLNKVGNLLTSLRRAVRITNSGPRKAPLWVLAE